MNGVDVLALPGPADAAAADGATVWCSASGRLVAYEAGGGTRLEVPAPGELSSLAAVEGILVGAVPPGVVVWLDPSDGSIRARLPVGGESEVLAGGGAVWAFDRRSGRAWPLMAEGVAGEPVSLPAVERLAADETRLWWTSPEDTLLHGGERPVELEVGPGERGDLAACSNSIWVSVANGLLRVGAWAAELGPPLAAPEGPVGFLECADGILVGASGRHGLFVLDPAIDAAVRHIDVDLGGELDHLVTTRSVVWAFPAHTAEARLVHVRPGE
jgi:hypothetical protein